MIACHADRRQQVGRVNARIVERFDLRFERLTLLVLGQQRQFALGVPVTQSKSSRSGLKGIWASWPCEQSEAEGELRNFSFYPHWIKIIATIYIVDMAILFGVSDHLARNPLWNKMNILLTIITMVLGVAASPAIALAADDQGTTLPRPEQPFAGKIERLAKDSTPDFPKGIEAPKGAPNILLILTDDVGFGASSTFGGPIATPTFDRVAKNGLRYPMFHTTALCSPTRAALITGRNHHSNASGVITEMASGYPGYNSLVPKSCGSVGEVLKENGYNTAWLGKMHNIPDWMTSQAGPFDLWPAGLGFEYFYGFIGGDSDQWHPALYQNTTPIEPYLGNPNYILDRDLADKAITWMRIVRSTKMVGWQVLRRYGCHGSRRWVTNRIRMSSNGSCTTPTRITVRPTISSRSFRTS